MILFLNKVTLMYLPSFAVLTLCTDLLNNYYFLLFVCVCVCVGGGGGGGDLGFGLWSVWSLCFCLVVLFLVGWCVGGGRGGGGVGRIHGIVLVYHANTQFRIESPLTGIGHL